MSKTFENLPSDVLWLILREVIIDTFSGIRKVDHTTRLYYFEFTPGFTSKSMLTNLVLLLSQVNIKWKRVLEDKYIPIGNGEWLFKRGSF